MSHALDNFVDCYNFCYDFLKEHMGNYDTVEKKRVAYITEMPKGVFEIVLCLEVLVGGAETLVKNFYYPFHYNPYDKNRKENFSMKTFLKVLEFLNNEGCEVRVNLGWGKEQGLWEHST